MEFVSFVEVCAELVVGEGVAYRRSNLTGLQFPANPAAPCVLRFPRWCRGIAADEIAEIAFGLPVANHVQLGRP